jgi:adenosine deaminase
MSLADFIARMPKVELHVHLEGSIRPETLLKLANRNGVPLPADTVEGLREWYTFRDFNHFVDIYVAASKCIKSPDDIELIAREFVDGQAVQNILHSEVTYTAETIRRFAGICWPDQLAALQRAREYANSKVLSLEFVIDIVREEPAEVGVRVADWAIDAMGQGVCALGLAGREMGTPAARHTEAFRNARDAGLKITTHAGETSGAESIWECLEVLGADRIGHGVRCFDDENLVGVLAERAVPVEVCPSSNVCLGVVQSLEDHPVRQMLSNGLNVSINSDDPPMFNTTLSEEWNRCVSTFGWSKEQILQIQLQTIQASFADDDRKAQLEAVTRAYFDA